jgi:hypothetical protein
MADSDIALLALDLRALLERTVCEAGRLISPVLERVRRAAPDPDLSPQDRYSLFLEATDCLGEERESGARLFFGFLCHAYALHERMGAMPDDELLDAAGRALESILATPDDDVPVWLAEELEALTPLPERDRDVADAPELLRRAFAAALEFAEGWCEAQEAEEEAGAAFALFPEAVGGFEEQRVPVLRREVRIKTGTAEALKNGADETAGLPNRPVEHGAQVQRLQCGVGFFHVFLCCGSGEEPRKQPYRHDYAFDHYAPQE